MSLRLLGQAGLALLIAFLLPITAHGDLSINTFTSTYILTDHPNFYRAIADEAIAVFPSGLSGGPYGPLFYYPTAAWLFALDQLHLIDIHAWHGSGDAPLDSFTNILLIKLPNLAVYLLVALVMMNLWRGRQGEIASTLWLANPAVILLFLLMGQNDGWAVLTSTLALALGVRAIEGRPFAIAGYSLPLRALAMVSLAIGAAIKLAPILLVLPFAWILGRSYSAKAFLAIIGFGAFLVLVAPFLRTEYFWEHGLLGRESGQVPDFPTEGVVAFYVMYLAAVLLVSQRDPERSRVLLFSFLALHALVYLLPGWKPQRGMLFLGALSLAVPVRRAFFLPYVAVTGFTLLLALEHRNEIASDLFGPLTDRALLIPPLLDSQPEPVHSALRAVGGLAWAVALASLWMTKPVILPRLQWSPLVPVGLIAVLVVYLMLPFSRLQDGIEATPYKVAAPTISVGAGQTFSFSFISASDHLRAVTFQLDERASTAAVSVVDSRGKLLYSRAEEDLVQGPNRINLGHIEEAKQRGYTVTVAPVQPIGMLMADVPPDFAFASARLNERPLPGTAAYTLEHKATWTGLLEGGLSGLKGEWEPLLASVLICPVAFGMLELLRARGSPR